MIVVGTTQASTGAKQTGRQDVATGGGNASPPAAVESTPRATPPVHEVPERTASDSAAELAAAQQRVQQHVQTFMAEHDQEARFSVDRATGMTIVQIVNRASGELVRQIPTEEVVRIAQFLNAQSAFVNVKA